VPIGAGLTHWESEIPDEERNAIARIFNFFEKEAAEQRDIPCPVYDAVVVVDRKQCHLVLRPSQTQGFAATRWLDRKEHSLTQREVMETARKVLFLTGPEPFYFSFSVDMLRLSEEEIKRHPDSLRLTRMLADNIGAYLLPTKNSPANSIWGDLTLFSVDPNLCFVIMPFEQDLDELYEQVIKPVVEKCGLTCKRADEIKSTREVMDDIVESICRARVIVADLTWQNPNVFYELGIAHTLGKETILISQRAITTIPFDLYHIRRIEYENTAPGGQKLKRDLVLTIKEILGITNSS